MSNSLVELIDANSLKNKSVQRRYIIDYLNEIVIRINKELKEAKYEGKHFIITEIPVIFNIPHTPNIESCRIIWSKTIELLKDKHFIVKINHNKDKCFLKISWLMPSEEKDIQQQLKLLNECSEKF